LAKFYGDGDECSDSVIPEDFLKSLVLTITNKLIVKKFPAFTKPEG